MIWMVFMISESLDSFAFIHHLQGIGVCSWTEVPFLIKLKPCGTSCVGAATLSYTGSVYLLPTLIYWLSGPQVGLYHPSVFTIDGDRAEWSSFPSKVSLPVCKKILNRSDHYGAIHIGCKLSSAEKFIFFGEGVIFFLVLQWNASTIKMSGATAGTYTRAKPVVVRLLE